MEGYGQCWITEKWKNKAALVEKNNKVCQNLRQASGRMSNKNDFMKIYTIHNRKKKKGKKSIAVTKR